MTAPSDQDQPRRRRLSEHYAGFLLGHRRLVVILLALLTLLAVLGLFQLRFDSEPRAIFQRSDDEFAKLEKFFADFGADDYSVVLVLHGKDLFSSEVSGALREFTRRALQTDGVESVISILDVPGSGGTLAYPLPDSAPETFAAARAAATKHPFLAGQLVSPRGETMLVTIVFERDDPQSIAKCRPVFRNLRELKERSFSGLSIDAQFSGSVAVRIETLVGVRREFFQISALGAVVALLIATALFRSLSTTLIVAAGPATAVLWTLGLMGWLGLDIEGISTPLPTIVFVVAFANAVHLMLDIRRSRRLGLSPSDAAHAALRHLGLACFLTSLTTAIGFSSLMLAETLSVQRFGLSASLGSLLGLLANLTVVPLLSSRATQPVRGPAPAASEDDPPRGFLAAAARLILRLSAPITLLAFLASGLLLWSALQLESDIVWTETLPANSEVTLAMNRTDQEFGGALHCGVVVEWPDSLALGDPEVLDVFRKIESLVEADPTFTNPLSVLNFLPPVPREQLSPEIVPQVVAQIPPAVRAAILRPDLRRGVLTMRIPNTGAAATLPAVDRMKKDLAALQTQHHGFTIHLTGSSVVAAENMSSVIGDLVRSLSFASITVFLVLTIALRSFTLGLLSILPNAFPLLLNAGILFALDKPLQITSVLTFSICLGIAVDDTIHFLMRFLRERKLGHTVRDSIVRSVQSVGLALLITTAIVAAGFAAAMSSALPGLVLFGGLACTALFAALLGDLVILPAMLERIVGKEERRARHEDRSAQLRRRATSR